MKDEKQIQHSNLVYLAPLQGFTDFVYRRAFSQVFDSVNSYFIPYISIKNETILKKYEKEFLLENNPQKRVIPQVLPKDENEILFLSKVLEDAGYNEINLNLGCPYPMVTNREKGAGLLPYPEKIEKILASFFAKSKLNLSVKMRAGLISENEIDTIIPVLNQFPLTEVILHPRIAKQLYSGEILYEAFQFAQTNLKHRLIYNGDICSNSDFKNASLKFPETKYWMLGRGILMNPFLPAEIKGIDFTPIEKLEKLRNFHQLMLQLYSETMDNEGNVLNKIKQFWIYFSYVFPNQHKHLKWIKKSNSLNKYMFESQKIFRDY